MERTTIVLTIIFLCIASASFAQMATIVTKNPDGSVNIAIRPGQERANAGPRINSAASELQPVVSSDEQVLYFVRKGDSANVGYSVRTSDEDIWCAYRQPDGTWGPAVHLPPPLNTASYDGVKAINAAGTRLYLQNQYFADGSRKKGFSVSERQSDGTWGFPVPLEIENYANDTNLASLSVTSDEKVIVLSFKGKDTKGFNDLYVSFRKGEYTYSEPQNIGTLSTEGDEVSPFIAFDDRSLYFSTTAWGAGGPGLYDVFVSHRLDDTWLKWSRPRALPYPVNTPSSDFYFSLSSQGDTAYVSSWHETSTKGFGRADLWKCVLPHGFRPAELEDVPKEFLPKELPPVLNDSGPMLVPGTLFRMENVFFDVDKASIRKEAVPTLNKLIAIMKKYPTLVIELQGHTDGVASDDHNLDLSGERALAVRQYLIGKGIAPERLEAKGYGKSMPIAPNDTPAGRKLNRRVMARVKSI